MTGPGAEDNLARCGPAPGRLVRRRWAGDMGGSLGAWVVGLVLKE
jgi:hypothetical protein